MTSPMTVAVTGAAGKTGRVVTRYLLDHGYQVRPLDGSGLAGGYGEFAAELGVGLFRADLRDYGQTVDALHGVDAVVHLAAIPAPDLFPASTTFTDNTAMNYNVFAAAQLLAIDRVVWASSETTFGLPFDSPPRYAPIDEDHYPLPGSTYALSKVVGETMAVHFAQWTGGTYIALRLSNVHVESDYAAVPGYQSDHALRRWNLWGYVDARDVGQACERALVADLTGGAQLRHRGCGHLDGGAQRRAAGGPVPRSGAHPRGGRARDAAGHRQGPPAAGLRPRAQLAGRPLISRR